MDMMEKRLLIYKTALLIIGSIVAAYGIMLAMGAGFGGATLAVLWQGMSVTFGMSLGMASFIVAAAMLIISLFYDRRQINAGTIVYQIIYSFFVDVFAKINVYPEQAWLCLAVMCVGIIIFAAGTGAYAAADLGKGSYEALTFSLAEKNNWPVKTVRTALDALLVVSGVLLGGKFGICTVFTVLCSGLVIQRSAEFCSLMLAKAAHRAD